MKSFLIILQLVTFSFCCRKHDVLSRVLPVRSTYDDYDYEEDEMFDYHSETTTSTTASPPSISLRFITCSYLHSLDNLSVYYSYQDESFEQHLTIEHSHIPTINPSVFSNFTTITKLSLGHIGIRKILPGAFNGLTKLTHLNLSHNGLSELTNGVYNSLNKLETLNLNDNKIHKLDNMAFHGTDNLVNLHLQRNKIKQIEDGFFDTSKSLNYLDLSGNPLENFTSLKNPNFTFEHLNLSESQITQVDFKNFGYVSDLDLSNNKIVVLENCQVLYSDNFLAVNNSIRVVTGSFSNVTNIDMSLNEVQTLNQSLFNHSSKIRAIDFSSNKISTIENLAFANLTSLVKLFLKNNRITKIDKTIFKGLTSLIILDLSQNSIEEFQYGTFDSLSYLQTLNIANNRLLDLHQYTLSSLYKLTYLYFDNNFISTMNVVDLKDHLTFLNQVSLNGNPWKCQQLVKIIKTFKRFYVYVEPGKTYDVENVNGIPCENEKTINNITKEENVEQFFSSDFRRSNFVKFFEEDYNNSKFFKILQNYETQNLKEIPGQVVSSDFSNKILIFSTIVQLFILIVLLCGFYFLCNFSKKNKQRRRLSQIELY